jgi:hypothetical protein
MKYLLALLLSLRLLVSTSAFAAEQAPQVMGETYQVLSDGSYLYKTETPKKSRAAGFRVLNLPVPTINGEKLNMTYDSVYRNSKPIGLEFTYEWQALQNFGSFGLEVAGGISTATGNGVFASNGVTAKETYTLYTLPLSLFVIYRFEYMAKQWVVPYVMGGATYYGLVERRDDGKKTSATATSGIGGGGGIHISVSRLDPAGEVSLAQQYGVSDIWVTLEARAMAGTNQDLNYTGTAFSVGMTVDY